jgi:hypothetical protein
VLAISTAFQADDEGSIPFTRSNLQTELAVTTRPILQVQRGAGPLLVAGTVIAGAILPCVYVERPGVAPTEAGVGFASIAMIGATSIRAFD